MSMSQKVCDPVTPLVSKDQRHYDEYMRLKLADKLRPEDQPSFKYALRLLELGRVTRLSEESTVAIAPNLTATTSVAAP